MDARLTSKDNFSARYSQSRQDLGTLYTVPSIVSTYQTNPFLNGMMSWTRTISGRDQRPADGLQPHRLE